MGLCSGKGCVLGKDVFILLIDVLIFINCYPHTQASKVTYVICLSICQCGVRMYMYICISTKKKLVNYTVYVFEY